MTLHALHTTFLELANIAAKLKKSTPPDQSSYLNGKESAYRDCASILEGAMIPPPPVPGSLDHLTQGLKELTCAMREYEPLPAAIPNPVELDETGPGGRPA